MSLDLEAPGFREYLAGRFGPEAGEATLEPLVGKASGIMEGGYGIPYRVRWHAAGGPRTLVLETLRFCASGACCPSQNDATGSRRRGRIGGSLDREIRSLERRTYEPYAL
jgi:hypothetical protein